MRSCASERTNAILRRLLACARTRLGWETGLEAVSDARRQPQIPTRVIVRALTVMFLTFYRRDLKPAESLVHTVCAGFERGKTL